MVGAEELFGDLYDYDQLRLFCAVDGKNYPQSGGLGNPGSLRSCNPLTLFETHRQPIEESSLFLAGAAEIPTISKVIGS